MIKNRLLISVLLAGAVIGGATGYWVGYKHAGHPAASSSRSASLKPGDVLLTNHTVSDIARDAGRWVVTVEMESPREDRRTVEFVPEYAPYSYRAGLSTGTGMVISPDGYVVTSNHVLGINKNIFVLTSDGTRHPAKIIGRDWPTDVAVLKIEAGNLPCATFGDVNAVQQGDWAVAIGSPMQLDHTISLGVVSAVNRTVSDTTLPDADLIQTDAAINPGNSGGPLLNISGQVIGMNTAIHRNAQNIAFAVPIEVVSETADALINQGGVTRGYIGLYTASLRDNMLNVDGTESGVYVILVTKGGPAAKAGISTTDIIKTMNGRPVNNNSDIRRILARLKPGAQVDISLLHNGDPRKVVVSLGQAPDRLHGLPLHR